MPPFRTSPTRTLAHHGNTLTRLHMNFVPLFVILALALASSTALGSQLFPSSDSSPHTQKDVQSFAHINEVSPLPLIMNQHYPVAPRVQVKGVKITKNTSEVTVVVPSTTLSENHVRSFIFTVSDELTGPTVTTSWNVREVPGQHHYVVYEKTDDGDKEIFSTFGTNLEESSHTFPIDKVPAQLILKVFHVDRKGDFHKIAQSNPVEQTV